MAKNRSTFERAVITALQSNPKLLVDLKSKRFEPIAVLLNTMRVLAKQTSKTIVCYEMKLNQRQNVYPDLVMFGKNIFVQIELKSIEHPSVIRKEILSLTKFTAKEFWYILDENLNVSDYAKLNPKVKVMTKENFFKVLQNLV